MRFTVENITPDFGAVIHGLRVDGDIDADTFAALNDVFLDRHVLVIPTGGLTPADQVAFSRRFGPLEIHAETQFVHRDFPEIFQVGNATEDGRPVAAFSIGVEQWHADSSYRPKLSVGSLFYAEIVPPEGGDTLFCDTVSAWRDLPEETRARVEGLIAVHDFEYLDRWLGLINPHRRPYTDQKRRDFPPQQKPLVRSHPVTGVKSLLLCPAVISHIEGMPPAEGRCILDALTAFATQDRYVYRHRWRTGDLVIWDNRCVLHTASTFDHTKYTRLMRRTTITS